MEHTELITELLGGAKTFGRKPKSDVDFIALVREGLPVQALASAAQSLDLSEDQALSWLRISKRTAARRKMKQERLRSVESERLLRLARAGAAATDVLGSRLKAVRWLQKPNRALGGEAPISLLDTDIGFQNVLDTLQRIEHGVLS
jgi:putative toxin-antitoxin system antitoxin component (TIGR02293 family)